MLPTLYSVHSILRTDENGKVWNELEYKIVSSNIHDMTQHNTMINSRGICAVQLCSKCGHKGISLDFWGLKRNKFKKKRKS